jgi:hypothetical protein
MTANESLQDETVNHSIEQYAYASGVIAAMLALLSRYDGRFVTAISLALMEADPGDLTASRLSQLLADASRINDEAYSAVLSELEAELQDFAAYEAEYQSQALRETIPPEVQLQVPITYIVANPQREEMREDPRTYQVDNTLIGAVLLTPFLGRTLREWFVNMAQARIERVQAAIVRDMAQGIIASEIVQKIRGTNQDHPMNPTGGCHAHSSGLFTVIDCPAPLAFRAKRQIEPGWKVYVGDEPEAGSPDPIQFDEFHCPNHNFPESISTAILHLDPGGGVPTPVIE